MHRHDKGFTLLEVLIALAILAISSLAVISQSGQSLTQLQQLHLKTTAMVVADNRLAVIHASPDWPGLGSQTSSIEMANQQWLITTEVTQTSDPLLRKIEVQVNQGQFQDAPLVFLVGYRGRH